jgi:hypothetical protein
VRSLTAVLVLAAGSVGFLPLAHAEDAKVVPTLESWYQPDPTCAQATGCLTGTPLPVIPPAELPVPLPTNPYPAGTLHVGWASSAETARSYLAFPVGGRGTITAATLDVPLDTSPQDGDAQSSTAKVQVCLATGDLVKTEGSISAVPAVDCAQHATLTYSATPAPHLSADLKPLLAGLATTSGVALLPDATAVSDTDAWRVVFSAHDRADDAKTPPATMTITTEGSTDVITPVDTPSAPPVDSGTGVTVPDVGTGFAPGPAVPGVDQQPVVPNPQAPLQTAARTVRVGYQYPAVWLLPLLVLVLVPMTVRALTKDLDPTLAAEPA